MDYETKCFVILDPKSMSELSTPPILDPNLFNEAKIKHYYEDQAGLKNMAEFRIVMEETDYGS